MSGVVLRCPACGTTQSHPGECDACFEGEVRYFCTNHDPGRWLDAPACDDCGARFGVAPPKRPKPRADGPTVPRGGASHTPSRTAPRSPTPMPRGDEPPGPPRRSGVPPRIDEPEMMPGTLSLAELLAHLAERGRRGRAEEVVYEEPAVEVPRRSFPVVSCIVRVVLFIIVMIALALGGFGLYF